MGQRCRGARLLASATVAALPALCRQWLAEHDYDCDYEHEKIEMQPRAAPPVVLLLVIVIVIVDPRRNAS